MKKILLIFIILSCVSHANAAEYYISASGSSGNGTQVNPWGPAEAVWTDVDDESSTVYLMGGTYTSGIIITHNTEANRLAVRPCSYSSAPSGCDGQVLFDLTGGSDQTAITLSGHNITVDGRKSSTDATRHIKLSLGNNFGVEMVTAKNGNVASYIELTGMTDPGSIEEAPYPKYYAINASGVGAGTEIAYNWLHDNFGQSDINVSGTGGSYGIARVHHNIIGPVGTVNLISCGAGGVDIDHNVMDATDSQIKYDIIHVYQDGISFLRIYGNDFINNDTSTAAIDEVQMLFIEQGNPLSTKTQKIRIYNNVFRRGGAGVVNYGIKIYTKGATGNQVDDVYIVNNSFLGPKLQPIELLSYSTSTPTYTNFKIENNILFNGTDLIAIDGLLTWANEADAVLDYNIINNPATTSFYWLTGGSITQYTALTGDWATDHSGFSHNVNADPLYISTTNLKLQPGSPAAVSGKDLSAYTGLDASWPEDKDSVPRTVPWSIGAYEYFQTGNINGAVISGAVVK